MYNIVEGNKGKIMKWIENFLLGILFVGIGLIWALNALGITDINIFFRGWWTLFIIIPSLIGLIRESNRTWNLIWLLVGMSLFLASNKIISFAIISKLAIPVILIILGLTIMFRDAINKKINDKIKTLNKDGLEEYCATFAGQEIDLKEDEFKGANLSAVFGGVEFDIRNCNITSDNIINASAIFGGVEIYVPNNVNVKVKSTPIFGGVSNKVKGIKGDNIPTIYINTLCMFGGVEVK